MKLAKTYCIETDRLRIRCYQPMDAHLLKEAIDASIEHLKPWMPWANQEPETLAMKQARLRKYRGQFDLGEDYVFGVFNKTDTKLIGSTGLHTRAGENAREIGYWISVDEIGKGYALETVKALIKVGFEIEDLFRLEIHCTPDNIRSQQIPQKLGFIHEATLAKRIVIGDKDPQDAMLWTMFKDGYLDNRDLYSFPVVAYDEVGQVIEY